MPVVCTVLRICDKTSGGVASLLTNTTEVGNLYKSQGTASYTYFSWFSQVLRGTYTLLVLLHSSGIYHYLGSSLRVRVTQWHSLLA